METTIYTLPANFDRRVTMGSDVITQITDNNALTYYETTAANPDIVFQIYGLNVNDSTEVDSVFLVGTNIDTFAVSVTEGGTSRVLMTESPNATEGDLQYALYTTNTPLSGTVSNLSITKDDALQPVRIYQCMIMKRLWLFPDGSFAFDNHGIRSEKRGSITKTALDYSMSRTNPLLNYNKHNIILRSAKLDADNTKMFFDALEPYNNFTFGFEYPRWPKLVFTGIFAEDIRSAYRTSWSGGRLNNDIEIIQS